MINKHRQQIGHNHPSAFTLVEMLVSVTLVLLIMSLFASIFGLATDTVKLQRGIAENDQRARALVTTVRNDFQKRTQRDVIPYYPTEDPTSSPTPFGTRSGYLYISTNNPASYHDDIIQFTVDARLVQQDQDDSVYYGASKLLFDQIADVVAPPSPDTGVLPNPRQPEADDRDIRLNNIAASNGAELMYFLRNGQLIRRVSLLRDPGPIENSGSQNQPKSYTGNEFLVDKAITSVPAGVAGGGRFFYVSNLSAVDLSNPASKTAVELGVVNSDDFLKHFDFSARPVLSVNQPTNALFMGIDALNNEPAAGLFPLAKPGNRWGFNPVTGFSREHDSSVNQRFIGRFVHAETSDPDFNWPLAPSLLGNGNPMDVVGTVVTLPAKTGVVTQFNGGLMDHGRGGERRVEDVLMTNVHELRIEIWDEAMGRYVTPGYGDVTDPDNAVGDYHIRRNLQCEQVGLGVYNFKYGPLSPAASSPQPAVFDTWHPEINSRDFDGDATIEISETQPPYIPYWKNPPKQTESIPGPSSPLAPIGDATYWRENVTYNAANVTNGTYVFARKSITNPGWEVTGSGFDWVQDAAAIPDQAFQIVYQLVEPGTTDGSPPTWPTAPGRRVADGTAEWEAVDNRRPLKSVRMMIRFKDQASDQIRQLTMNLPLTDD
ncbi:MAG: type II secretion system GspH family protein [Fuerstiella sp.]|nr:type II secretion system GspH family protein [Fuerstiella sp.]